ncbi:alpha/beta hydrolase-fold protein [soil metagenome]
MLTSTLIKTLLAALSLAAGLSAIAQTPAAEPLPQATEGRIERWANFPSKFVDARHVDIWLPADYTPAKRYAVVYMHDGQMLFDPKTTWNKQAWNVDQTVTRLVKAGRIPDLIVVGPHNNGKFRHSEYFPQKYLAGMPEAARDKLIKEALQNRPQSDAYLRFLVEELKPAVDAKYATKPGRDSTFVMGSSMGGLISVYAMNQYPQVFGGAAGLSTHWIGGYKPNSAIPLAAFNDLRANLADPATHRLYQDHGTIELDALYAPYQVMVDDLARERGYEDGKNFMTRVFEGTGHNEVAWATRLEIPLLFLFGAK